MRRYRCKREYRIIYAILLILFIFLSTEHIFKATITNAVEPIEIVTVSVKKGDSLWKIADLYDNNKMDIRKYIDIIQDFNNLDTTVLQPGDQIKIPIYENIVK